MPPVLAILLVAYGIAVAALGVILVRRPDIRAATVAGFRQTRLLGGWLQLSRPWRLATAAATVWMLTSGVILLITSAQGDPLPSPWRGAQNVLSLVAWVILAIGVLKAWRSGRTVR